jgi:hypothetical protein
MPELKLIPFIVPIRGPNGFRVGMPVLMSRETYELVRQWELWTLDSGDLREMQNLQPQADVLSAQIERNAMLMDGGVTH